jgi:uncharacterized membrane protein
MAIAYAVTYSVTYIETGSTKAAQSAGLSAALFMGIGGLRGFKWIVHYITVSIVTLGIVRGLDIWFSTEKSSNLGVIHSKAIVVNVTNIFVQMAIAYAVTYSVTYIETGSAKAARLPL